MNKSPTDVLREEHDKVLGMLDRLEKGLEDKDLKSLERNILLLSKEFDRHSLNKEEKVLFPEIEKFIAQDSGPTEVMRMEHKDLTESIKNFAVYMAQTAKTKDFSKLQEIGSHIIDILRQHIDKENNILFMIVDMHLEDKQKKAILEKFRKIDAGTKV